MPTYLTLCQDARRECGIAGADGTPTAVTGQTGQMLDLVRWVSDGYVKLQNRAFWKWMRRAFTFNTVIGTREYAYGAVTDVDAGGAITRFRRWWVNDEYRQPRIYLTSGGVTGERYLQYIPFSSFYRLYMVGPNSTQSGPPYHVSVDDQNRLVLGPKPDAVYTVGGDFQRSAQVLAVDGDVPELPADFHPLLVYEAMRRYAGKKSAPEVMSRAVSEGNPLLRQLELDQMPPWDLGAPLA
jgi:hypothetical protein